MLASHFSFKSFNVCLIFCIFFLNFATCILLEIVTAAKNRKIFLGKPKLIFHSIIFYCEYYIYYVCKSLMINFIL